MRILALDLASNAGFCNGIAGQNHPPRSGVWKLKDSEDAPDRAFRRLGIFLRDEFVLEMPDYVVIEAPIFAGAMKGKTNAKTGYVLTGLVGAAHGICGPYGIRSLNVSVQKVRKHFIGIARPHGDPKIPVIAMCHQRGLVPKTDRNDNRCDAVALWDWAVVNVAKIGRLGGMR